MIDNDGIYIKELDMYCYISEDDYKVLQELNLVYEWYTDTWDADTKYLYYTTIGYSKEEIDELF